MIHFEIERQMPQKRDPESKRDTLCKASKTLGLHYVRQDAQQHWVRSMTVSRALLHYGIAMRGEVGEAMPAEGHSKGTVHWCCQTKGSREAYCTSRIHLPNSSPESKKRETISAVQFER